MNKFMPYFLTGMAILAELIVLAVCTLLYCYTPHNELGLRFLLFFFLFWHVFYDPTGPLTTLNPRIIKERFQNLKKVFS
jgi:hypothetical protein